MNASYQNRSQDKSQVAINSLDEQPAGNKPALQLKDNRPQSAIQKKQVEALATKQASGGPVQKKANGTGLPDKLKSGIENLSGHSMDDVKVHYNSAKPAQLNAHAYAQGTEIHVASGQEKHLPHEAWHVVQQKQGKVKPTTQMKGKVNINDDKGLEKEADLMGAKALQGRFFSANGLKNGTRQAFLIQRVGVGQGPDDDNDRGNIVTEPLAHNATVSATGDNFGRARISQFLVNGINRANYTLKHYMVISSGTMFQLPIKYFAAPAQIGVRNVGRHGYHTEYQPNNVPFNDHRDDVRGGQPEAFGGVDDLAHHAAVNNVNLAARRDATLNREYAEENHNHGGAVLNVIHSKAFAMPNNNGGGMAGTISIARTNAHLNVGHAANNPGPFLNRGDAEMAGTIVINCNDLINGVLYGDALELAIGARIEAARDAFHQHMGVNAPAMAPFNINAGIIAHLVGMMKDEILAQRGVRNMQRIAVAIANLSQQHQAREERRIARNKLIVLVIALGLITFLAIIQKMLAGPGSGPKEKDEL